MTAMMMNRWVKDMDGLSVRVGDRVVCLTLPVREKCLSTVVGICDDGTVTIDNGHIRKDVDPSACVLQTV